MRLFLCGFMGTGKSTVARILAKRLNSRFIDMDEEIEKEEGLTIPAIFKEKGEPYFREREKIWVKRLIREDNIVVSCGGGTIIDPENFQLLNNKGYLILLEARPEVIWARTSKYKHRPLLNVKDPKQRIRELLDKREPYYRKVPLKIDTSFLSPEEVSSRILNIIYGKEGSPHTP